MIAPQDRFWSKVEFTNSCWLWKAYINKDGYGVFRVGNSHMYVHRVVYAWLYGDLPPYPEMELDHLCKIRNCVNPDHLEAVIHIENTNRGDYSKNGEMWRRKTHCPQGHMYTPLNIIMDNNTRKCRECNRLRCKAYQDKRRKLCV